MIYPCFVVNKWHSSCGIMTSLTVKQLLFAVNHPEAVQKTYKPLTAYRFYTLHFIFTQLLKRILQRAQFSVLFPKDERVCTCGHDKEESS